MNNRAAIAAQITDIRQRGTTKSVVLKVEIPEERALEAIQAFGWPTGANPVPVAIARLQEPEE